jgi:serine/threonine-protein kinase
VQSGGRARAFDGRFAQEASLYARLAHPNLVALLDHGSVEGQAGLYFLATERLEGVTLCATLASHPRGIDAGRAVAITVDVARALQEMHLRGLLHRALRPSSVLLLPGSDQEPQARLVDLGGLTVSPLSLDVPPRRAPEQLAGEGVDRRSDIHALGLLLFELLTGRLPDPGDPGASGPQAPGLVALSAGLGQLIARMLRTDPRERPSSLKDVLGALRATPEGRGSRRQMQVAEPTTTFKTWNVYQLGRKLSQKPASTVQEATQADLGHKVVLKLFSARNEQDLDRLRRELPDHGLLRHPSHTRVLGTGVGVMGQRSCPYMVFEFLQGRRLDLVLDEEKRLSSWRSIRLVRELLGALSEMHAAGLVHRNLGPDNLFLVSPPDRSEQLKILGYNPSSVPGETPGDGERAWARLPYLSPEILAGGRSDEAGDVYAVAVLLYRMLSGELPHEPDALLNAVRQRQVLAPRPLLGRVVIEPGLAALVERAVHLDPALRYRSADEMLAALDARGTTSRRPSDPSLRATSPQLAQADRKLWAAGLPVVWVLADDSSVLKPSIQAALEQIGQEVELLEISQVLREPLLQALRSGEQLPPWVILFGDLHVIREDRLLAAAASSGEVGRLLVSAPASADRLRRALAFCGLDLHVCPPEAPEVIARQIRLLIERIRGVRAAHDHLRQLLGASG